MSAYVEVHIETAAEAAELVAAAITDLTGGVEMRDAETVFPTARDRAAVVALCAPQDETALLEAVDETLATARAAGTPVDPVTIRRRLADEEEWRDKWKQFFRATRVGKRFVVRPSWDPGEAPPGEFVIDLDPGRAFGTGAHPSTRLVIGFMEQLTGEPATFLDLGCGSGILSIVGAWLWPKARGLAIDLDRESTECAVENFERNHVTTVQTRTGSIEQAPGTFPVILANIQADVLCTLAPALAAQLAGTLILSGLLTQDVPAVQAAYDGVGLRFVARADEGEWAALRFEK